jgi:hypothetical protein
MTDPSSLLTSRQPISFFTGRKEAMGEDMVGDTGGAEAMEEMEGR